jgi:hypothetical protein
MEWFMEKYIPKKLLSRVSYGLLMVTGSVGSMAHVSQGALVPRQLTSRQIVGQSFWAIAEERIPDDPNGDTWYLQAVRTGDLEEVQRCLANLRLDLNVVDNDRNTDLMLAIIGGGAVEWEANYREIFNLIVRRKERNFDAQNRRGETALLLAVRLGRVEAVEALMDNR